MRNNPRILVVDDDANLRKTLSDILKIKGYGVVAAGSGAEGIAEAERTVVNVALIDLKLPDMSGIEVMEKIKASSPLTEAIILTGHASLDTAVEATNKGAFSYLLKPYEIDKLLRHIHRALDRQQTQQAGILSQHGSQPRARGQYRRGDHLPEPGGREAFPGVGHSAAHPRRAGRYFGHKRERRAAGGGARGQDRG